MKTLPFIFTGTVQTGHGQGADLGARTANFDLILAEGLPPGLYACHAKIQNEVVRGLLYYGYNSLTKADCLEVHFLDFTGNLYEKNITVTVDRYIRAPKIFTDPTELAAQIKLDLKAAEADIF